MLIDDFAGLARRAPLLAVGMTVFMISLAGVPPTGGFWAKIFIFRAAIDRGGTRARGSPSLMLVNSVISVAYYFAVPRQMIFKEPADAESPLRAPALVTAVVSVALVAIVALFILPNLFARLAEFSHAWSASAPERPFNGRTLSRRRIEPPVRRWSHEGVM